MSSNKLFNISNGYMTHCGINRWDESIEKKRVVDYMYLAKTAGPSTSIFSTYILFLTKLQKKQIPLEKFPLMISENTMFLKLYRALINSSKHKYILMRSWLKK
jgi:hypothetical protein